jgi:tetratricopeptide (TPR) repeat protein
MEFIPSLKLDQSSIGVDQCDRAAVLNEERLIALSSWMMILGTIRVLCTFADLVRAFLIETRNEPVSMRALGNFVEINQPFLALGVIWPMFLGIMLRRTRWPELLPAAGVSFLILSIGGLLESVAEWNHANSDGVTFGSFHLTRLAFLKPTVSDMILGLLGSFQLLIEFATAVLCLLLARRVRGSRAQAALSSKQEGARRARLGRLAIYASSCFLVLMIRLPVWSTYVEIINDSRIVREFVLKNDFGRGNRRPRQLRLSKAEMKMRELQQLLGDAAFATSAQGYLEAKEAYFEVISRAELSDKNPFAEQYKPALAQARNNVAWLLATCPKIEIRDARQALENARAAVAIEPKTGTYWNTLGVALYRNGDWDLAKDALSRSMELRGDGDSFDWFFLAMIHFRQGRKDQARDLYARAVEWYQTSAPNADELYRFQVEAALELGLPKPAPQLSVPMRRHLPLTANPAVR